MLSFVPLLAIPLLIYNLGMVGLFGAATDPWATEIFSVAMMSGGVWSMKLGDVLVVLALVLLFVEVLKSTRHSRSSVIDHLLSTLVFVIFLVEFLLVRGAAHPVFFTLMVIALIDLLAGFSVSIRSAGRDVTIG